MQLLLLSITQLDLKLQYISLLLKYIQWISRGVFLHAFMYATTDLNRLKYYPGLFMDKLTKMDK